MSLPYKFLAFSGNTLSGDRDALVELRSAINDALGAGVGHCDVSDEEGDDVVVTVERIGG